MNAFAPSSTLGANQPERAYPTARLALLTIAALLAFASNSLLCRQALSPATGANAGAIDPISFTAIRLTSGALLLAAVLAARRERPAGDWGSAAALFVYALPFTLAYRDLTAGTGALLAFGAVQLTMLASGLRRGERLGTTGWLGFVLASAGLLVLTAPGLAAPPLGASLLMAGAGAAWGVYSLRGRRGGPPIPATGGNFLRAGLLGLLVALPWWLAPVVLPTATSTPEPFATGRGILLAVVSGALTSGLGYVLWYAALPHLGAIRAAVVQLATPVLAALGGVLLLAEPLAPRLLTSAPLILGGIALAIARPRAPTGAPSQQKVFR